MDERSSAGGMDGGPHLAKPRPASQGTLIKTTPLGRWDCLPDCLIFHIHSSLVFLPPLRTLFLLFVHFSPALCLKLRSVFDRHGTVELSAEILYLSSLSISPFTSLAICYRPSTLSLLDSIIYLLTLRVIPTAYHLSHLERGPFLSTSRHFYTPAVCSLHFYHSTFNIFLRSFIDILTSIFIHRSQSHVHKLVFL